MLNVQKIVKTCEICPAQWEGLTDDNRQIYVRYRWGCLQISVGPVGDMTKFAAVRGKPVLFMDFRDPFHGDMEYRELKKLTKVVVALPKFEDKAKDW